MKATRTLFLALLATSALAAAAEAKLNVVTTVQDLESIARLVGGDRVDTFALAKGYQDPHFVDAKPSFILKLSRADLLVVAGRELEVGYLPPMIDQSRNRKIQPGAAGYLDASNGCEVLQVATGQVTRAGGDVHPFGNPHYWTDPENGRRVARALAVRFAALDPAGKAVYTRNLAAFEQKLTAKEAEWKRRLQPYAGVKVVTFHNSWPNFAKHFRLNVVGHVEPKPGIPPTPSHTLEIIRLIQAQKVPLILIEPYFDSKTPNFIAGKTGAKVVTFYPSVGGKPGITDYFALFDADVDALVAALGGK